MNETDVTLFDGEELLHEVTPSWVAYTKGLTIGTILTCTTGVGAAYFYVPYARKKKSRITITTDRVIIKSGGVRSTETTEYRLTNIDEVTTRQSFKESIRNKGTVEFTLREKTHDDKVVTLSGISDYEDVKTSIRQIQYESSER